MRGFYDTEERIQLLFKVVVEWLNVPFLLNGKTKEGAGCAGSQHGIHIQTGALEPFEIPRGTTRLGDQIAIAHMSNFLKTRPEFFQVENPEPGDIITGKTRVGEFHLGTYLGIWKNQKRAFVHCLPRYGMSISNLFDPTYEEKRVAVWRIKHEEDRS